MALPVSPGVVHRLVKEVSSATTKPLVVGGARELAPLLRKELARDARPGAVRADDRPEGAAVLVYVLAGDPTAEDEAALRRARAARVPVVAVSGRAGISVPYVLATDIVHVPPGRGFPVDEIAEVVAARLGEDAAPLAAAVPVLRKSVTSYLITAFSRKNGIFGAAIFIPGADLPVLALNQIRMVMLIEQAHGLEVDLRDRLPEIVATVGLGLGLRAIARELLDLVPVAGWAVKGAVAFAGTRAIGEAALLRLGLGR